MLLTLLGGTPQSGSALAEAAGISRSLASAHLQKLVAGGLVRAQASGLTLSRNLARSASSRSTSCSVSPARSR